MTDWFLHDDPGYLAWLADSPDGYVLNTYAHVAAGYLVLHRASCRTINRSLAPGKLWTRQYGKACAGTGAELVAWAVSRTGSAPTSCSLCGPDSACSGGGPRRSVPSAAMPPVQPTFEGTPVRVAIERMDHGPALLIEGAQWLAEMFFRLDASATGALSYDASTRTTDKVDKRGRHPGSPAEMAGGIIVGQREDLARPAREEDRFRPNQLQRVRHHLGIEVLVVELPVEVRDGIRRAQVRQFR